MAQNNKTKERYLWQYSMITKMCFQNFNADFNFMIEHEVIAVEDVSQLETFRQQYQKG